MPAWCNSRNACLLLIAAVLLFNGVRAVEASVTTDEAFTYVDFASPPLKDILSRFDANHHVLHSLACKLSLNLFGVSEFALRLPSLISGALYLLASLAVVRVLLGNSWLGLVALAWLSLHPIVLDYLSLARGYSMALALWTAAVWLSLRNAPITRNREAGVLLGLAAAANLTFFLPGTALAAAVAFTSGRAWWRVARDITVPFFVTAFLFISLPLRYANREHFYFGAKTLSESLHSILGLPLKPEWDALLFGLCAVGVLGVAVLAVATRRLEHIRLAGLTVLCAAGILGMHLLLGSPYPLARTGLYLWPLCVWCLLAALSALPRLHLPLAAAGVLLLPMFLVSASTTVYDQWRSDAGNRRIATRLAGMQPPPVVTSQHVITLSLKFYRDKLKAGYTALYHWQTQPTPSLIVLLPEQRETILTGRLEVLYDDPVAQTVLARLPEAVQLH